MEKNDLSGLVGSLLSDPKAMESIRQMAESLKIGGGSPSPDAAESERPSLNGPVPSEKEERQTEDGQTKAVSPPPHAKGGKGKTNELTALLTAVKPFLGKEKCKTVDDAIGILRIIGLSGQTDLLKGLSALLR